MQKLLVQITKSSVLIAKKDFAYKSSSQRARLFGHLSLVNKFPYVLCDERYAWSRDAE